MIDMRKLEYQALDKLRGLTRKSEFENLANRKGRGRDGSQVVIEIHHHGMNPEQSPDMGEEENPLTKRLKALGKM